MIRRLATAAALALALVAVAAIPAATASTVASDQWTVPVGR